MNLAEQLNAFDQRYPEVKAMLHREIESPRVHDLGMWRLEVGHKKWGDQMFHWSHRRLIREMREELADGLAYGLALSLAAPYSRERPRDEPRRPAYPLRPEDRTRRAP